MSTFWIKVDPNQSRQNENDLNFIGGIPRLPQNISLPCCKLCGAEETFYFQVAFPEGHNWFSRSLALFACTSCVDENYLIPELLNPPLKGIHIPKVFLDEYQRNFKVIVFETDTGIQRFDYQPKVKFQKLVLHQTNEAYQGTVMGKMGGQPLWYFDDETPATYDTNIPMVFLFQVEEGFNFETLPDAPPQIKINLLGEPEPSSLPFYKLFLRSAIYFFGTEKKAEPKVYILVQN